MGGGTRHEVSKYKAESHDDEERYHECDHEAALLARRALLGNVFRCRSRVAMAGVLSAIGQ